MNALWIVGKALDDATSRWEFQGVFSDEGRAVNACRDETYFVGPATLDEEVPHETTQWPGSYYPKAAA